MSPSPDTDAHTPAPVVPAPAPPPPAPTIDEYGIVRFHDRWTALPSRQAAIARLLLANLGQVVPVSTIEAAYRAAGGTTVPASLRTLISRLRSRLHEVDLRLSSIRGHGLLLEPA